MRQLLKIAHYEILHIFKDPILFLIVFIAPLAYTALFGAVYFSAAITDVPLAIVDLDNSQLSREVGDAFRHSPYFQEVAGIDSQAQLERQMREGGVRAGVVIAEDFSCQVALGKTAPVLVVYDASNLIWGYNIRKSALEVINQFSSERSAARLAGLGLTPGEIKNVMDTVSCTTSVWYNPTFSYTNFLFMGLVMMIIHQLSFLSVSLTITREKEKGTWVQYLASTIPGWQIFLGKCLPYMLANFFNYALLLWAAARFVQVKIEGNVLLIVLLGLLYGLTITCAGFFVSVHSPNSLQVTRYLMLMSVPFFLISGYTWPTAYMPAILDWVSKTLPFAWMAEGFRLVTIKGLGALDLAPTIAVMSIMACLSLGLALTFKKQAPKPEERALSINCGHSYPRLR